MIITTGLPPPEWYEKWHPCVGSDSLALNDLVGENIDYYKHNGWEFRRVNKWDWDKRKIK